MNEIRFKSDIDVSLINSMGGDHMIVAAAKVSTNGTEVMKYIPRGSIERKFTAEELIEVLEQDKKRSQLIEELKNRPQKTEEQIAEENAGLINYLVKMRHGTPFEHSALTFFVHAPIFVWREWHRHRIGFCVAGDTFVAQETISHSGRTIRNRPISELWDNWHNGVTDRPHTRKTAGGLAIAVPERKRMLASCRNFSMRVLDEESQFFELGQPTDVIQAGVKEMLFVDAGKHQLRCSADHRIYTDGGWVRAGDLRRNDLIAVCGRRSKNAERQIPPSLRRGIGVWTSIQRDRLIGEHDDCYLCGVYCHRSELVLDHVVPVVADITKALDVGNLRPICEACNKIKTASEQKLAKRANVAGTKFVRLKSTPRACSEEVAYDISMGGKHHNFIANGIVVHNSYNEESGRYKQLEPVFYLPDRERPMMKVDGWKPGRPKFTRCEDALTFKCLTRNLTESYFLAYEKYQDNLDLGIDPGLARDCLPVGIYSGCWVTCNPRSLMAFLSLRVHEPDAAYVSYPLWEIDMAARACEKALQAGWPITHAAFLKNGRVAP